MVYNYILNGLQIKTGDIICTKDGDDKYVPGQFWRLIGLLIPGEIDHVAIYIGPEGRCIEAGPKGVIQFILNSNSWNANDLVSQRGPLIDELYGIAYPLKNRNYLTSDEEEVREAVSSYCKSQLGKPYNINFFDSTSESSFYCSQLINMAYLSKGISLNSGKNIPNLTGSEVIIFPEDIWESCSNIKI